MPLVSKEGFSYKFETTACENCHGACCTGESGYIYLNKKEILDIASLLKLEVAEFKNKYLYKTNYKYSIKEIKRDDKYDCVFFDYQTAHCKIYQNRPTQCKTFPFWDYYKNRVKELKIECPGVS